MTADIVLVFGYIRVVIEVARKSVQMSVGAGIIAFMFFAYSVE